jgi:putative ABC transport system permease protein
VTVAGRPAETRLLGLDVLHPLLAGLPGVETVALYRPQGQLRLDHGAQFSWGDVARVEGSFFRVARFSFVAGRRISDILAGGRTEVVLTAAAAVNLFGAPATALGRSVRWTDGEGTVVGVVADVAYAGVFPFASDAWATGVPQPPFPDREAARESYQALLLLDGHTRAASVRTEFRQRLGRWSVTAGLEGEPGTLFGARAHELSLLRDLPWPEMGFSLLMAAIAVGIMVLPALCLVNISLGSLAERRCEIALRRAFGGSARQIAVQVLLENLVLTVLGALTALIIPLGLQLLGVGRSAALPGLNHVTGLVVAYLVLFTVIFSVLSGAVPAWRMARLQPLAALQGGLS